jgi:hypothetical protein
MTGVQFPAGARFFSSPQLRDGHCVPSSLLCNGYGGALSLGVKRPERDADNSPPSIVEIKNGGAVTRIRYTSSWHGDYLTKHREHFAVTFSFTFIEFYT